MTERTNMLKQEMGIYEQLTGEPRQDFFNMLREDDNNSFFLKNAVEADWNQAISLNDEVGGAEFVNDPEHLELFQQLWHGNASNSYRLYDIFDKTAQAIANQYARTCNDPILEEDIKQAAYLGIGEAISSIIEHRTKMDMLGAVVHFRIVGEISNVFRRNNMFGSIAYGMRLSELNRAKKSLLETMNKEPAVGELSELLGWTKEEILTVESGRISVEETRKPKILEKPSTEDTVFGAVYSRPREDDAMLTPSAEDIVLDMLFTKLEEEKINAVAKDALNRINDFDRDIFERFYGLNGYESTMKTKEIAAATGETPDNVRQILSRTRRKLQKSLVSPYDPTESVKIVDGRF